MQKISRKFLFTFMLGFAFANSSSFAETKLFTSRTDVALFRMRIALMDRMESENKYAEIHFLDSILPSAYAIDQQDNPINIDGGSTDTKEKCIIAGYIGFKNANGYCQFPEGKNSDYKAGGDVTCNPDVFGPGVTIHTKGNHRWTNACAEALYKKAGVNPDDLDDDTEDGQKAQKKLSDYLRKALPASDNWFVKQTNDLCVVAHSSKVQRDIDDCEEIQDIMNTVNESEKSRIVNQCAQGKLDDAGKPIEKCADELFKFFRSRQTKCGMDLKKNVNGTSQSWDEFIKSQNLQGKKDKPCYPKEFFDLSTSVLSKWINDTFKIDPKETYAAKTLHVGKRCDVHVAVEKGKLTYVVTNLDAKGADYEKFRFDHTKTITGVGNPINLVSKETTFDELAQDHSQVKEPHHTLIMDILQDLQPACMDPDGKSDAKAAAPAPATGKPADGSTTSKNKATPGAETKKESKKPALEIGVGTDDGKFTLTAGTSIKVLGQEFTIEKSISKEKLKKLQQDYQNKDYKALAIDIVKPDVKLNLLKTGE